MEVGDKIYCFEVARRSVGRAALHLGIESMSEEALDTMADILLQYLSRFGKTLAHSVEASNRTSSHCNVLDAFAASELVTSPSVSKLHFDLQDQDSVLNRVADAATPQATQQQAAWQRLATFCFGSSWLETKSKTVNGQKTRGPLGGKQGPPSIVDGNDTNDLKKDGWNAPYLNEVSHFPQATQHCANPHSLNAKVALSLHPTIHSDEAIMEEYNATSQGADDIPDGVFTNTTVTWGSQVAVEGSNKRKIMERTAKDDGTPTKNEPPSKRVKIDTDKNTSSDSQTGDQPSHQPQLPYVPTFYPLPPRTVAAGSNRTIVDVEDTPEPAAIKRTEEDVKVSLVSLGHHFWGSGWENESADKSVAVPFGRSGDAPAADETSSHEVVVPLGRASGSRISRILEGSMDAAAMQ